MEVSGSEISKYDAREIGYCRKRITLDRVSLASNQKAEDVLGPTAVVWCYVDAKNDDPTNGGRQLPTREFPIIQSYLDVILDGCVNVGGEIFARNFIASTVGWGIAPGSYLEDRAAPGYIRSSVDAAANAALFDSMLASYKEGSSGESILSRRTPL
jgi:hypothetical protein